MLNFLPSLKWDLAYVCHIYIPVKWLLWTYEMHSQSIKIALLFMQFSHGVKSTLIRSELLLSISEVPWGKTYYEDINDQVTQPEQGHIVCTIIWMTQALNLLLPGLSRWSLIHWIITHPYTWCWCCRPNHVIVFPALFCLLLFYKWLSFIALQFLLWEAVSWFLRAHMCSLHATQLVSYNFCDFWISY